MLREQARKRLTKKAKKGFRGFPVAETHLLALQGLSDGDEISHGSCQSV
jgi:hypothetical protein